MPDFEMAPVELPFEPPQLDSGVNARGGLTANAGVFPTAPGTAGPDAAPIVLEWSPTATAFTNFIETTDWDKAAAIISGLLNFAGPLGLVKGAIEALIGEDLITGRKLEWWEALLNGVSLLSKLHAAEGVIKWLGEIGEVVHGTNMGVHGEHVVDEVVGAPHGAH